MGIIDEFGRPTPTPFENGSVPKSKYQGWCEKHGLVWLYDWETKKPKVNGGCGICYRLSKTPGVLSCTIHGIVTRGPGGRCGECEARGLPPVEDHLPSLDETDDDPGGTVPADGVDVRDQVNPKPLP